MVIEPLSCLGVREVGMARGRLRRALERGRMGLLRGGPMSETPRRGRAGRMSVRQARLGSRDLDSNGGRGHETSGSGVESRGVQGPQGARVSKPRLLVGMFQLLLEGYPSTGNKPWLRGEVTVNSVALLLVREVLHGLKC